MTEHDDQLSPHDESEGTESQPDEQQPGDLTPEIFDGRYDSPFWQATRGRPPWYVVVGIWCFSLMAFCCMGGGVAIMVALGISFVAEWLVMRYSQDVPGQITFWAMACISVFCGSWVGRRWIVDSVRITRLRILLGKHSSRDFHRALRISERQFRHETSDMQ